jgi:hemerythrin-like domain-containing protein
MPEGANVTTELQQEHSEIEHLVQRVASLEPGPERAGLVRKAQGRFLTHARVEQRYLYPAFERYLPHGADEVAAEQHQVNALREVAKRMEHTDEQDEGFEALVGEFVLGVQQHIERQDGVILAQLLDVCPREEVNQIGRQIRYGLAEERGGSED